MSDQSDNESAPLRSPPPSPVRNSRFIVQYGKIAYKPPAKAILYGSESEPVIVENGETIGKIINSKSKAQWACVSYTNVVIVEDNMSNECMYALLATNEDTDDDVILRAIPQAISAEKVAKWVENDDFDVSEYSSLATFSQSEKSQINPKTAGWTVMNEAPTSCVKKAKVEKPATPAKRDREESEDDEDVDFSDDDGELSSSSELSRSNTPISSEPDSDSESNSTAPTDVEDVIVPPPPPMQMSVSTMPGPLSNYAILVPMNSLHSLLANFQQS